jgi:hypothetical protein
MSADQGMDQGQSPPQGKAVYPGTQPAVARALQLLRTPRQRRIALPLLQVGQAVCVQMAQPKGRKTEKLYLGSVRKSTGPIRHSPPENHRGSAAARGLCMNTLFDAKASTTEEPDAGKLHVRFGAGCALKAHRVQ